VIKVEKPGKGDDARGWGPPFHDGMATIFQSLNRNKRSVAVDLQNDDERARLKRLLVEEADVLIQNLRPGQAEKIGLGADALCAENPRLIYATIGAFGDKGPLAGRPGYDPLMQAFGGIMSVTGEIGRPPIRVGTSIIDMGAGMWIVIGVLSALYRRAETGKGGAIGTSLFETALGWMLYHITSHSLAGELPVPQGSGSAFLAPYGAYKTADGDVVIAAGNDNLYRKAITALGRPDLAEDPRFAINADRVRNRQALNALITEIVGQQPSAHWVAKLEAAGVPCAPAQTVDEVVAHPQTAALDIVRKSADQALTFVGLPLSFDGKRPARNEPVPSVGRDTEAVLKD
jgi:crotonobetainyl-CoA:carnitine CoA-transferase CaiB-like acyl-CoA transferase